MMDEQAQAPENQNPTPEPAPTPPPPETPPTPAEPATPPTENPVPAESPAPTSDPAATLPNVPSQWPGAFGVYKFSKQAVKINVWTIVIIWVLNAVIGGAIDWKGHSAGSLAAYVLGALASAALTLTYIAGVRGQRVSVGEAISKGVSLWLKMIGLTLLSTLIIVISLLLLIVPFFFVAPRLALINYFLVDKKMGVIESIKASWAATKGNVSKVYGILGANVAMGLLMITIIGIPFSIYFLLMYSAATAVLYEMIQKSQPAEAAQPSAAPEVQSTPPVAPVV